MAGSVFTTNEALAVYMLLEVDAMADDLQLTSDSFSAAVERTLLTYFAGDGVITDATDFAKITAIARYEAWSTARKRAAAYITSSTDGQAVQMKEYRDNAAAEAKIARADAAQYLPQNQIIITPIVRTGDPYYRAPLTTEFG